MPFKRSHHEFRNVAQELTNRIIEVIEATGKLPYKREWDPEKCAGPQSPPAWRKRPGLGRRLVSIIMEHSGFTFRTGGDRAFYSPLHDLIQLPPDIAFPKPEYWSATAIHEIGHSTGHPKRMNRNLSTKFGSDAYACEEARVEMAAVFVCNTLGLPTDFENSARYVGGWLKKLREDKREILHAAADAQKIADHLLNYHPDFAAHAVSAPERPAQTAHISIRDTISSAKLTNL